MPLIPGWINTGIAGASTVATVGYTASRQALSTTAGTLTTAATATAMGVPWVATVVVNYIGFTGAGVCGGSIAAGIQSGIGNVVAGSTFAAFQSLGATGGVAILGPVGITAGAVGLVAAAVIRYRN